MTLIERVAASPLNYRATLVVDPVMAAALGLYGVIRYEGPILPAVASVGAGLVCWSFLEYLLHRWILHGVIAAPRRGHAKHHSSPTATISTPVLVIPMIAVVTYAALATVLSSAVAALIVFGIYAGYNYFSIVHHLLHHRPDMLARAPWFEAQTRLHDVHHHNPNLCFGVSNGFWDRLFGTLPENDQIVVKQPHC